MDSQPSQQPDHDDRRAIFVPLYTQNQHRIFRYILSLLPDWTEADDIMADTSIRLWEQFDKFEPGTDFGAWGCTIAHYLVLARRKEAARERRVLSEAVIDALAAYATQAVESPDNRISALRHCLQKLSAAQRLLIDQLYSGSQTVAEAASSLGQSRETISKRVSRVRIKLHKCIQVQLAAEGDQ